MRRKDHEMWQKRLDDLIHKARIGYVDDFTLEWYISSIINAAERDYSTKHAQTERLANRVRRVRRIAAKLKALIIVNAIMITICLVWAVLKGISCLNSY